MEQIHIHCFQHVPFEGLGYMEEWFVSKDFRISSTRFYNNESPPDIKTVDWLVILGGPMGVYDYDICPWLYEEKRCIEEALRLDKIIIGVCLGAQLIAEVLGAQIKKNRYPEIGWFPINISRGVRKFPTISHLPEKLTVFHWHSDTFDLPGSAVCFASSEACENQAFIYKDRVIGLQFHMESKKENVRLLSENCKEDIVPGKYVQSVEEILALDEYYGAINGELAKILDGLSEIISSL